MQSPHCQGGWWGSADVRRCPLLQVNARYGRQGIPADDRERHGLATAVAPRSGRLDVQGSLVTGPSHTTWVDATLSAEERVGFSRHS